MYLFFLVAGVFAMIYPAQVILRPLELGLAYLWAGFLVLGGLLSSFGSLRGKIGGEIIGNPLLAASNAIFGGALLGFGSTAASLAIGFLFWGFAVGLTIRWMDVKDLAKISQGVSDGAS